MTEEIKTESKNEIKASTTKSDGGLFLVFDLNGTLLTYSRWDK